MRDNRRSILYETGARHYHIHFNCFLGLPPWPSQLTQFVKKPWPSSKGQLRAWQHWYRGWVKRTCVVLLTQATMASTEDAYLPHCTTARQDARDLLACLNLGWRQRRNACTTRIIEIPFMQPGCRPIRAGGRRDQLSCVWIESSLYFTADGRPPSPLCLTLRLPWLLPSMSGGVAIAGVEAGKAERRLVGGSRWDWLTEGWAHWNRSKLSTFETKGRAQATLLLCQQPATTGWPATPERGGGGLGGGRDGGTELEPASGCGVERLLARKARHCWPLNPIRTSACKQSSLAPARGRPAA
ncbi:hypothetical protein GQ53DRAFT_125576 [Thozetella sp. PMI_491]|nr:hypothetical protein GQ53DRAFT_125576 [Thozetella sp. PMI_491]